MGELAGFGALAFTGASALLMIMRARLMGLVGGVSRLRSLHVTVSVAAVIFIAVHVYVLFLPPTTLPVLLGYAAVALGTALWLTGVGFLERNRDSFFLHGGLALALVSLVTVHAAASGTNIPVSFALAALVVAGGSSFVNAAYHWRRIVRARR